MSRYPECPSIVDSRAAVDAGGRRSFTTKLALFAVALMITALAATVALAADDDEVAGKCMTCHKEKSPGLYRQWYASPR
jgi:hypothetical protein